MVTLQEEVELMIGSLAVPSITNVTFSSRPDSTSAQTAATDPAPLQGATVAGGTADQDAAGRSPSSATTQSVTFDPALLEMIYRELDARTDQVLGQIPMRTAAGTYQQTRANRAGTTLQPYTIV
jgi:hypothetical protein